LDEAGRGSLFGPVFAAAVVFPQDLRIKGINDSKQLAPEVREELAFRITSAAAWAVASVDAADIDKINIYQASRLAMKRAVLGMPVQPDFLLVDALRVDVPLPQRALIKGDARSFSIAAASILAKVWRDRLMREWDQVYPQYGLARSKGYCTPEHLTALARFGPCVHHRFTFEPVWQYMGRGQLPLALEAAAGAANVAG
jgi:ribonuclease HII